MPTILSGMKPSGRLHLGNYEGALKNWVRLQADYRMFLFIADWHALTEGYDRTSELPALCHEMVLDYLAAGLDPKTCAIFRQSDIKETAELHLLFSMITPLGWLERVPTFKDKGEAIDSYGFLGYPLLQSADILLYKADAVPVGKDQLPHIELTREVARRFNFLYTPPPATPLFPEPQGLLTKYPDLPGQDNRKMSKTYGNYLAISDPPKVLREKVSVYFTDPLKVKRTDPGRPELCPVYTLHQIYNANHAHIPEPCSTGDASWGCVACKRELADTMIAALEPIQERRAHYEARPDEVRDILSDGASRARAVAVETIAEVRAVMHLDR